jgi:hypothetical protein
MPLKKLSDQLLENFKVDHLVIKPIHSMFDIIPYKVQGVYKLLILGEKEKNKKKKSLLSPPIV